MGVGDGFWPKVPETAGPRLPETHGTHMCVGVHVYMTIYVCIFWAAASQPPEAPGKGETGLDGEHWTTVAENATRVPLPWP